jgi:metal transporter CNNM
LLDYLLGKGHTALLGREELKTLVSLHGNEVNYLVLLNQEIY